MKFKEILVAVALVSAVPALFAQESSSTSSFIDSDAVPGAGSTSVSPAPAMSAPSARPFSKVAFGVGISPLGVQLSMTTNLNPHLNLRSSGNLFNYSTNFTASGIGADAKLNMKSAGTALDIYPFYKGFRISPGLLFYNANQVTATALVAGGTSFTLNDQTYYSANANSATGNSRQRQRLAQPAHHQSGLHHHHRVGQHRASQGPLVFSIRGGCRPHRRTFAESQPWRLGLL